MLFSKSISPSSFFCSFSAWLSKAHPFAWYSASPSFGAGHQAEFRADLFLVAVDPCQSFFFSRAPTGRIRPSSQSCVSAMTFQEAARRSNRRLLGASLAFSASSVQFSALSRAFMASPSCRKISPINAVSERLVPHQYHAAESASGHSAQFTHL